MTFMKTGRNKRPGDIHSGRWVGGWTISILVGLSNASESVCLQKKICSKNAFLVESKTYRITPATFDSIGGPIIVISSRGSGVYFIKVGCKAQIIEIALSRLWAWRKARRTPLKSFSKVGRRAQKVYEIDPRIPDNYISISGGLILT